MGSSESSLNSEGLIKVEEQKVYSSSSSNMQYIKKTDCEYKRIKHGKYQANVPSIYLFVENIVGRFDVNVEKIQINSYLLGEDNNIKVNELHLALDVHYITGSRFKIDSDSNGPRYDMVDNYLNLKDCRPIEEKVYEYVFTTPLMTDHTFLNLMHMVTLMHLELNTTYSLYSNKCRLYCLLLFDYFFLYQYLEGNKEKMIEYLTLTREVHIKLNSICLPPKLTQDASELLEKMSRINPNATEAFIKQYKLN
jgi:hypothetical protein